jgi:muramoyltetrapeptide carboxypeptidase
MFKRIKRGSTIGVIAPAWIPNKARLEKGIAYLNNKGFKTKLGKYIYEKHGYFAGSDQKRLLDLHQMYADPEVIAIFCARGGWGSLRLLDKIDYRLIRKNPKPLIGYSDITGIQLAIWSKCQIPSFSGPFVAVEMGNGINPFTEKHLWGQLNNSDPKYIFNFNNTNTKFLSHGNSTGILVGGCLSLITSLLGTSFCPNYENTILFIEEVGEKPYRIDRNLAQMKQAGIFNKISGLILGNFIDCENGKNEPSFTVEEIFHDYFSESSYPVIMNFPYGHNGIMMSIPIGIRAIIDFDKSEISFDNPFFHRS